jgi:hypothetical protein
MNENIEHLKGSMVIGFSFPTPGTFELKCIQVGTLHERTVRNFDLLFLRVENVEILNNGSLADSEIIRVEQDGSDGTDFRFDLSKGFVSINCQEMRMRSFET